MYPNKGSSLDIPALWHSQTLIITESKSCLLIFWNLKMSPCGGRGWKGGMYRQLYGNFHQVCESIWGTWQMAFWFSNSGRKETACPHVYLWEAVEFYIRGNFNRYAEKSREFGNTSHGNCSWALRTRNTRALLSENRISQLPQAKAAGWCKRDSSMGSAKEGVASYWPTFTSHKPPERLQTTTFLHATVFTFRYIPLYRCNIGCVVLF